MLSERDQTSRLFGRDCEVKALRQAFHQTIGAVLNDQDLKHGRDGAATELEQLQEFVFIQGPPGSGKTSLANSLRQEVYQCSGFFLSGKFELTSVRNPYAVIVVAFNHFVSELRNRAKGKNGDAYQLSKFRKVIHDAIGTEGRLLTDVIPSLQVLIGKQKDSLDVRGANTMRRFQYLFCKLCHAISSIVPIVLFFDDVQWSDTASLHLLKALLMSQQAGSQSSLLVIVASSSGPSHQLN